MYGEVPKGEDLKKLDADFIKECLKQYKTIDSSANVHIDFAWRYFYNNDLPTAMKRFNQAWLLDPEIPDSYFGFAALTEMSGDLSGSERLYKMGIAKDETKKRTPICYQRIADCKEQLKDFRGTIDAYTKLSQVNPSNSFAFKKIGYFEMEMRHPNEAISAYSNAIELDASDAVTYNNRAYLYQTQKDYKKAIADYSKAINLDSKYISAYVNRGMTEIAINNVQAAKEDFQTCVQLDPKAGELWRFLGLSKVKLNDLKGACVDFETAKKLGDKGAIELIKKICL